MPEKKHFPQCNLGLLTKCYTVIFILTYIVLLFYHYVIYPTLLELVGILLLLLTQVDNVYMCIHLLFKTKIINSKNNKTIYKNLRQDTPIVTFVTKAVVAIDPVHIGSLFWGKKLFAL